jgi:hypothetical protein
MALAFATSLAQCNSALRCTGIRLRIEQRGKLLCLRGPLPQRNGEPGLKVQRLSLGLNADEAGLALALQQLHQVQQQVNLGGFIWPSNPQEVVKIDKTSKSDFQQELQEQLQRFEAHFFNDPRRRRNPAGARTTWFAAYRPYLNRIANTSTQTASQTLSVELLEQVLESYELASRARQQCGLVLAVLARFQGIVLPADWPERAGGYGLHQAQFRSLPSDNSILEAIELIPNPAWQLAYGLMATYGLRNHELFFCDFAGLEQDSAAVVRVLPTTKTGEHQVWPFQPEWVDRFNLRRLGGDRSLLPPICTDLKRTTLQQVGRRVAEQFRRYQLPFTPYDLRHAWALRTIHIGLPDTVAARMMGHSVAIHTRTYHHWITRRDQQMAVDAALARRSD